MHYFRRGFFDDLLWTRVSHKWRRYYIQCDLKKAYLEISIKCDFFLLISCFLLLSLLLCLPFCFISPFLCGFPLFGEGRDFRLRSWLVSGRSQETWFGTGTSWSATWYKEVPPTPRKKVLCWDQACSKGGCRGRSPKGKWPNPGQQPSGISEGWGTNLLRLPGAWMIRGGFGCPGDRSITIVSSKHARGTPARTPGPPSGAYPQIPGFASKGRTETRTGFGQNFAPHKERPVPRCARWGLCVYALLNYTLFRASSMWLLNHCGDHSNGSVDGRGGQEPATGFLWGRGSISRDSDSSLIHRN